MVEITSHQTAYSEILIKIISYMIVFVRMGRQIFEKILM